MKKLILLIGLTLYVPLICFASEGGPLGGKLVESGDGTAEILIEDSGKLSIVFYDKDKKPVAPTEQQVSAIAEAPEGKATLKFVKSENLLVSESALPKGEGYLIVVQIRDDAKAKPHNVRLRYNMHKCGECNKPEYACTCDH